MHSQASRHFYRAAHEGRYLSPARPNSARSKSSPSSSSSPSKSSSSDAVVAKVLVAPPRPRRRRRRRPRRLEVEVVAGAAAAAAAEALVAQPVEQHHHVDRLLTSTCWKLKGTASPGGHGERHPDAAGVAQHPPRRRHLVLAVAGENLTRAFRRSGETSMSTSEHLATFPAALRAADRVLAQHRRQLERTTRATRPPGGPPRAPITAGGARRHGGRGDHAGAGDGESGSTSAARATEARDSRVITNRSDLG